MSFDPGKFTESAIERIAVAGFSRQGLFAAAEGLIAGVKALGGVADEIAAVPDRDERQRVKILVADLLGEFCRELRDETLRREGS